MKTASLLPVPVDSAARQPARSRDAVSRRFRFLLSLVLLLATFQCSRVLLDAYNNGPRQAVNVPLDAAGILEKCSLLETKPGPPPDFYTRTQNDRFVSGTKPTLIKASGVFQGS